MENAVHTPERRIDAGVRLMRFGGALCAMFAAVGITTGIREMSPEIGWAVPILAGLCAAAGFAIIWHFMIGHVIGMVRTTMLVTMFVVAAAATMLSWSISAQSIATMIAGQTSMRAELAAQIDGYNQALAKAYAEATGWSAVATSAGAKAAGYESQADSEAGGGNGNGKGCGPKCTSLRDIAAAFRHSQTALTGLLHGAADLREKSDEGMTALRDAAARGDREGFMIASDSVAQIIASLNAIDPRPIIANTGDVVVTKKGIDLSKDTKEFQETAAKALANRKTIDAPHFVPVSVGEATRNQMFGAALIGWIMAGVIDLMPFLFLVLAFSTSREVYMNEGVTRKKLTPLGKNSRDREVVGDMLHRDNVRQFPGAAE